MPFEVTGDNIPQQRTKSPRQHAKRQSAQALSSATHLGHPKCVKASWTNIITLLTALAVPGAIAPYFSGWHWSIDLAACFPVQSTLLLITGSALLLIRRKWLLSMAFASFSGMALLATVPGWMAVNSSQGFGENSPEIKVLSLNLLHSNTLGQNLALRVVRDLSPDLIWLAEYTPRWQRFLCRELPDYPYRCQQPSQNPFGAALFSRHPIPLAEMVELGHSWTPACRAVIQSPHGPIGFLGVHTPPPGFSYARSDERNRALQAIPLSLQNLPERRIVCGDFNATPWNAEFARLKTSAGLFPGTTTTWLPTWPAGLPSTLRIPIDHILVAGNLRVRDAKLGANILSDHLPLFATIQISE